MKSSARKGNYSKIFVILFVVFLMFVAALATGLVSVGQRHTVININNPDSRYSLWELGPLTLYESLVSTSDSELVYAITIWRTDSKELITNSAGYFYNNDIKVWNKNLVTAAFRVGNTIIFFNGLEPTTRKITAEMGTGMSVLEVLPEGIHALLP